MRLVLLLGIAVILLAGAGLAVLERSLSPLPPLLLLGCVAVLVVHDGRSLRKAHQKLNRIQALVAQTAVHSRQPQPCDHDALLVALDQARADLAAQHQEQEAALGRIRERAGHTNAQFEWLVEQMTQLRSDAVRDGTRPRSGPEVGSG